jgi:GTP-binding protein
LLNVFREKLPFRDIPIKLYMRSRKQTEPGERSGGEGESDDDLVDLAASSSRAGMRAQAPAQGGHLEFGTRFLNREVNELLAELDN